MPEQLMGGTGAGLGLELNTGVSAARVSRISLRLARALADSTSQARNAAVVTSTREILHGPARPCDERAVGLRLVDPQRLAKPGLHAVRRLDRFEHFFPAGSGARNTLGSMNATYEFRTPRGGRRADRRRGGDRIRHGSLGPITIKKVRLEV
jgi:hypothetical protein